MRSLKRIAIAAATALLAFGPSVVAQVNDYHQIQTPPLRKFTMPQPKRIELSNGMVIFLQEDHELPLIRGTAEIRGGERDVPASKAGLADIYGEAWRTGGTESKTGDQLDDLLESRAARLETNADDDSSSISMNVLKQDFDTVFPLFVELLQKPAFRQDKIDLAKTQERTGISRRNDEPGEIAGREVRKLGYGADSPYTRQPEYDTIASITRDDLLAFHDKYVHPNDMIVGFVGDFDSAALEKKLRAAFGSWKRGPQAPPPPKGGTPAKPGIYYVAKDDVTQSNISVVHPGGPLRSDPDFYAISVMNEILSGGFSGRLMNSIRSKAGLAYGVGGGLGTGWDHPMLFNVSTATKSGTTLEALNLVKDEISKLQTEPFTADELSHAKESILNAFVFTADSKAKVLNQRMQLEFYGYPADYWQKYQAGIDKVTADDVSRVARKYVHPDQLAVLIVGNGKDFEKPLSSLGNVTALDVTIPEPGASTKPAATPTAAAAPTASTPEGLALLRKAQSFAGGKAKLDTVNATHTVATTTMKTPQGDMDVEDDSIVRFPDSQRHVVKTPMGDITTVLTPEVAFMASPMGARDIPASQRDAARGDMKLELLSVLKNGDSPSYVVTVTGSRKIGDVDATELTIASGTSSSKWYVDPATGRVIRAVRQGRMGEQAIDYADWKDFGGLKLPSSTAVTVNGEKAASTTVKSLEVNPTIDAKAFQKPEAKAN